MSNRLANENSPYLIQHADNPVDWYPWGPEALEKARSENRPIFLSIGYAACHWCHVMAHESFEDSITAEIMNDSFVNIKVDREERPDLDGIYMQAVVSMTGSGGWPMSVFLTPDGMPFYGGTYFPPVRRYQMPAFREILQTIARLWQEDRPRLLQSSQEILNHVKEQASQGAIGLGAFFSMSNEDLNLASLNLGQAYDWKNGGWGKAPKFPQPLAIEYLLRRATRGDSLALDVAAHALQAMAAGGMYDVVGGGFARYSTDDTWLVPHFEKMLYDNALLAQTYLHAWLISGDDQLRRICEETLDFVLRELTHPAGGFYSSLDADNAGEEGQFYVWALDEIREVIGDPDQADLFIAVYGITLAGNFDGKNVLQRVLSDEQAAEKFSMPVDAVKNTISMLRATLLSARQQHPRPATDDKILVAWNGLMLVAFAEAGRYFSRQDYLVAAQENARFLLGNLYLNDRLLRSWRNGAARHNAYLEDYAALILALLALYQTDSNLEWYTAAVKLAHEMVDYFTDPSGGFFDTRDDHEELIFRPKDLQDNATPSGNALAATALLQLDAYGVDSNFRSLAERALVGVQQLMVRYPTAFSQWLCAADYALGSVGQLAILGLSDLPPTIRDFQEKIWKSYYPRLVVAYSEYPPQADGPILLHDRPLLHDLTTAYLCQGFICQQPTNSVDDLLVQLQHIL